MGLSFNATGMGMMTISLGVLVMVGLIFLNLQITGFAFNQSPYASPNYPNLKNTSSPYCASLNCPAYSSVTPCATSTNCQLGGFIFLNPNSPFTFLFNLNLGGFINSWGTNLNYGPGPLQLWGGTQYYGQCQPVGGSRWWHGAVGPGNTIGVQCAQQYINGTYVFLNDSTYDQVNDFYNFNNPSFIPYTFYNMTFLGVITPTCYACAGGYVYTVTNSSALLKKPLASGSTGSFVIAFNNAAVGNTTNVLNMTLITGPPTIWKCGYAVNLPICQEYSQNLFNTAGAMTAASTNSNFVGFGTVLGFVGGLILLLLGLGLGFNVAIFTNAIGITPDSQGTRMFQCIGIGLLVWSPFFSEFSQWIIYTGPFISSMITILLTGLFFFGLWQQFTSAISSGG